jgi:hypothetical protein
MWLTKLAGITLLGLGGSFVAPLDHPAINYHKGPENNAISKLNKRLATGKAKLTFDPQFGYLPAVLEELRVARESQVLVFSKTSFQAPRIAPRTPRALYYNDEVSVGYVQGGDVVELAVQDPKQGIIFYSLDQDEIGRPRFERRDACLQCHESSATLGVPGIVVRSVSSERSGMPAFQHGTYVSDHRSKFEERWGGWYVTGETGKMQHMGNSITRDRDSAELVPVPNRFDPSQYLTPHSDVVALLVLEHQTHMTNLLTRAGFEIRHAIHHQNAMNEIFNDPAGFRSESTLRRIRQAAEEVVDYMFFVEETPLPNPVSGSSGFAETFAKQGPCDPRGRSLRQFDLKTRIFRYPLSYMIYSEAFDQLPAPLHAAAVERLQAVLNGEVTGKQYAHLTPKVRAEIRSILQATKPQLFVTAQR